MEAKPLIPAAQYVRMSTEDQQYSIVNQEAAIQTYANRHGFFVLATYADAGKSGIEIKHRKELRRLLADVVGGRAKYKVILVYDVSRWGRFQDVDEAAHYEFLCKSAGVPVRYCAEQFENDGSLPSSMMKAMKRTMAAEFSRELGIKVSAGQSRLALLGFRVVGKSGYGLRRMMVSPDGRRRLILKDGERKAIQTDRTILVPGPKKEVDCVRTIFGLAADLRKTPREIAKELNGRHMHASHGRPWDRSSVYRILTNEKYAGCNIYGKTTQKLCSRSRLVERHLWITNPDAFVSIVSRDMFDRVQKLIKKRGAHPGWSGLCRSYRAKQQVGFQTPRPVNPTKNIRIAGSHAGIERKPAPRIRQPCRQAGNSSRYQKCRAISAAGEKRKRPRLIESRGLSLNSAPP